MASERIDRRRAAILSADVVGCSGLVVAKKGTQLFTGLTRTQSSVPFFGPLPG